MSEGFPIMGRTDGAIRYPKFFVPWALLAAHEQRAMLNHNQSLRRLAERGGLGVCEAVAVIEDRGWKRMDTKAALDRLAELVSEFKAKQ